MQCPIPVEGCECGADAKTQSAWISQREEFITVHFNCTHGHRFHIGARERWQVCRCHAAEKTVNETDALSRLDKPPEVLLVTLSAQKGIQVIVR
jgi:hypothetical protein